MDVAELRSTNSLSDLTLLDYFEEPCVIEEPLTLGDIVEIALIYNLDVYAQEYERETQARISNAEHLKMLPALTLDAFYSVRSKTTASISKRLLPPDVPDPGFDQFPQISSLKTTFQDDIRLTFNFIDMGLAYFRTKQAKERVYLLEQQHLRARQKLVLDITEAYWKAVGAKQVLDEMDEIVVLSDQYQEILKRQVHQRTISEFRGLQIAEGLADQRVRMELARYQYQTAKMQLAALMGMLPSTQFELATPCIDMSEITFDHIEALEQQAIALRPELAIKDLEEEIALERIKEAIVPMFPNVSAYRDWNYDGNPFLIHNYWWSIGIRTTWNLLLIPQKFQEKRAAEAQRELAQAARLALSISILAQVHLAYLGYRDAFNQYLAALRHYEIRNRLYEVVERMEKSGELTGIDTINYKADALLTKINLVRTLTTVKIAEEQINFAIGRPFYVSYPELGETVEGEEGCPPVKRNLIPE